MEVDYGTHSAHSNGGRYLNVFEHHQGDSNTNTTPSATPGLDYDEQNQSQPASGSSPLNEPEEKSSSKKRLWTDENEGRLFQIWGRDNWRLAKHGKNLLIYSKWADELREKYDIEVSGEEVQAKINRIRFRFRQVKKDSELNPECKIRWKRFSLVKQIMSNQYRPADAEPIPQHVLDNNRDAELLENCAEPLDVSVDRAAVESVATSVITTSKVLDRCDNSSAPSDVYYTSPVPNTQYNGGPYVHNTEPRYSVAYNNYSHFNEGAYAATGHAAMHAMQQAEQQPPACANAGNVYIISTASAPEQLAAQRAIYTLATPETQAEQYSRLAMMQHEHALMEQRQQHQHALMQSQHVVFPGRELQEPQLGLGESFAVAAQQSRAYHMSPTPTNQQQENLVSHHQQQPKLERQEAYTPTLQQQQQSSYQQSQHTVQPEATGTDYQMFGMAATGESSFQGMQPVALALATNHGQSSPRAPVVSDASCYNQTPQHSYTNASYNSNAAPSLPSSPTPAYMTPPQQRPSSASTPLPNGAPQVNNNSNRNGGSGGRPIASPIVTPTPRKRGRPPNQAQPGPESVEVQYLEELRRKNALLEENNVLTKQRNDIESRKLVLLEKFLPTYLVQQQQKSESASE